MASTSNVLINSRSMNGVITISDGIATLENGDLTCDDINSDTSTTNNLNSNVFTCNGEIRSNLVGPYTIPTFTSSLTGSLISYGNTLNSGATDFTNYGSTYNLLKQGFYFNNINSTTTLTNLAIIDNSQTYFKSQLVGCTAETPLNTTSIVNKTYCDSNFVDRVNSLQQNINGLKTFTNNTNFTATLLARTNIKLSEYENSPLSNNVTLSFPMPETIALRTTSLTNNNMTVTLPTLTNNERGYVFTFNKLFNPTYGNFNVTFQTSGGNYIFTLLDQSGGPTSNTTLLSIDKIQCKLAVGFFGTINYWVEQTDFSTFDRSKLQFYEWQNPTATNSLTLSSPLPPTIALRASTPSMMTITLPTLTTSHRGQIFTFVKVNPFKFDVTFNTSSSQFIFPLNNLAGTPTTNTTIFPSTKATTRLAVGWFSTITYWIEVSDYSTLDIETNNGRYVDFTSPQIISGVKSFSSLPTCSVIPTTADQLINKSYSDTNFQLISNMTNYVNITTPQNIDGVKTFSSLPLCSVVPSTADQLVNKSYVDGMPVHGILNSTNAWTGFNSFNTNLPTSTINPTNLYELVNKNYVDGMPVHGILGSTNAWTGFNSFNTNLPTSSIIPTTQYQLVNKNYTDTTFQLISNMTNYVNITTPQNVAGVKTFSSLPICSVVPSTADQLINKLYSDTNFQLISNMNNYVNITSPQNIAGIKTFSSLPLCTVVPSTVDQLVNKNYTDTKFQLITNMTNYVDTANAQSIYGSKTFGNRANFNGTTAIVVAGIAQFDGTTTFTTNLPTCSITATTSNQLVNYTTLTTQGYITSSSILSASNAWTGFNSFNTNLPTSSIIPTTQYQLVNKNYTDTTFQLISNMTNYVNITAPQNVAGVKTFSSLPLCSVVPSTADQLINKLYSDTNFQLISNMNNYVNITAPQNVAGIKTFSSLPLCTVVPSTVDQLVNKNYTDTKFQLITNMTNYLTTTAAASTYLTQTNAASTYVDKINTQIIAGDKTFNGNVTLNGSALYCNCEANFATWVNLKFRTRVYDLNSPFTNNTQIYMLGTQFFIYPQVADSGINFFCRTPGNTEINTFTSTTTANTSSVPFIANAQATFNNNAPVSNVSPTLSNHLTTKSYVDGMPVHGILSATNAWTGFNSFDTNLPTSTIIPTTQYQLVNKNYVDGMPVHGILNTANAWINTNTFNSFLPTSTLTATSANQLVNYTTLTTQGYTTLPLVQGNANTFTNTNEFTGDVTLSKTKNNSTYATYNGLNSTYIGYMSEVIANTYLGIGSGTQYQLGAITRDSTNVGFWTCNYEVEINCITAGSISKIYVFVSNNSVSPSVPIGLPGAKANNFSTQTYAINDSTYHSGSFSFLQSTTTVIYGVQLIAVVASGTFQRKGQIRMLRIL